MKAKTLADEMTRERLDRNDYSEYILNSLDLVQKPNSSSGGISNAMVLMDIAWQISGNLPSENELAKVYFPIHCYFLGTVYQDNLLDSFNIDTPRSLVKSLGMPTCLIMGNILYSEALLSLSEIKDNSGKNIRNSILTTAVKMVRDVMESEINRRKHIGRFLSLEDFLLMWRRLSPNKACIEIGGIMGRSDRKVVKLLEEIGSNISITQRILKEIGEIYGLKGSLITKMKIKPPPLPISIAFKSATSSEKMGMKNALKHIVSKDSGFKSTEHIIEDIKVLVNAVTEYNSISVALEIHRDVIKDTKELIDQLPNSDHKDILNKIVGTELLSQDVSKMGTNDFDGQ
jgi:geranylgeranyl pyrophosphate synthase